MLRRVDTDRYDDREHIRCNLVEAYDKLMAFVAKHLPDKFYLQGDQRISLREKIFREIIANMLIHREYTNAYPSSFVINKNKVETKNANRPHLYGQLTPDNFEPFPKNPHIAQIFTQMGRSEELGTGIRNVYKYTHLYSGSNQILFQEEDIFVTTIPIDEIILFQNIGEIVYRIDEGKVGDKVGEKVGKKTGDKVGDKIGDKVGKKVGEKIGYKAGNKVGINKVGKNKVGKKVGDKTGDKVGKKVDNKVGDKIGDKVGDTLTENQQKILMNLTLNPIIKASELASIVGISKRKIEENISKLKAIGLIARIGPNKGGEWKITVSKNNGSIN